MSKPKQLILTASEFEDRLSIFDWNETPSPSDRRYFCPSLKWLKEFAAFLANQGIPYTPQSHDCDDYADAARVEATRALLKNPELLTKEVTHTFIRVDLFINKPLNEVTGHHATNLCLCDDEQFYFIEPQNGQITKARKALAGGSIDTCDRPFV
jgi:hypothetical protein